MIIKYIKLFCLLSGFCNAQITYFEPCTIPSLYIKSLYSIENGLETSTQIKESELIQKVDRLDGQCFQILKMTSMEANKLDSIHTIYKNKTNDCYFCYEMFARSANVIQYRRSQCQPIPMNGNISSICDMIIGVDLETGFVNSRQQYSDFNCKSIIEGIYSFEYRIVGSTGMCRSPNSILKACQRQGSPLRDNSVYEQTFGFCPNFYEKSVLEEPNIVYGKANIWRCYGRWVADDGTIWAAVEYDTNMPKYKYRCLTTRIDQQNRQDIIQWGMTVDADCKNLKNYFAAPIRLVLEPAFDPTTQLVELQPTCKLPTNLSGDWFYPSEYQTSVKINSTHIFMRRRRDSYTFEDIYFVCRQQQLSRYLMAVVTRGQCEIDFMCFELVPRHHNIARFRMGRPFPLEPLAKASLGSEYMLRMYKEACHWSSFTLNYIEWTYEYFVLDPPVPINCPIQGKYKFIQTGQEAEKYVFKMPGGMTPRPWLQVLCFHYWQTNIEACLEDPKILKLDVQKCWRLDFTGRPISEYDITDNYIACVGYWMEDTKSYLITYDREDPVSNRFRCWVYQRNSFRGYSMSRSLGNRCGKMQTSESSTPEDGASLRLELMEDEYEFDVCPMAFDDGANPYANPAILNVYATGQRISGEIYIRFAAIILFRLIIF